MKTFFRLLGFIAGLTLALLAGDLVGRWLAPGPETGLYRGLGSVISAGVYTWLFFKLLGPIGPDRPEQ